LAVETLTEHRFGR